MVDLICDKSEYVFLAPSPELQGVVRCEEGCKSLRDAAFCELEARDLTGGHFYERGAPLVA